jgi:hypothetical protein
MKINEAAWDRVLRVIVGMGLLALSVVGPKTLWGLLGAVPLATGLLGHCPLYRMLGVSTCTPRSKGTA